MPSAALETLSRCLMLGTLLENPEFQPGALPIVSAARTEHWFDPCALLLPDARSEYREEYRERQCGGG